jgi:NADH-quinone oxidoreductase subunit M
MTALLELVHYSQWILHVLLVLPLVGVAVVLLAPVSWARWLTLIVAVTELVLSLGLWWAFDPANGGLQFRSEIPWIASAGISYSIGLDGISLFMVLLSTIMMPLLVFGSWRVIDTKQRGFYALMLAMKTGMLGVFLAMDMFLFYCCWELLLIPMYFTIGIWGSANRLHAANKFIVYAFSGSLLMLVAIVSMVWTVGHETGIYSFGYEHLLRNRDVLAPHAPWLFTAFALAFAVKVPLFPFHTWLPDAHVEAPTAGSVDLAVILLKMGAYGFLRFGIPLFPAFALSPTVGLVFVSLSVTGIIFAALVAMVQPDFKKLIAYSSVSHLGFVMLGVWAGTVESVQGAIVVMVAHGISTGALFFLVGMLYERRHSREIRDYGGIATAAPLLATAFIITAFASIGLPGLNGFVGEFLVLLGSFGRFPIATGIATTVVVFAAAYLLWAVQRIFFNRAPDEASRAMPDLDARELSVLVPLVLAMVLLGLFPDAILSRTETASARYVLMIRDHLPGATTAAAALLPGSGQ